MKKAVRAHTEKRLRCALFLSAYDAQKFCKIPFVGIYKGDLEDLWQFVHMQLWQRVHIIGLTKQLRN